MKYIGLQQTRLYTAPVTPSSPINYQCGLITWLITALNCLCSRRSTHIFTGRLWTQWKVWQSRWLMVFVLSDSVHLLWAWAGSLEREGHHRDDGCGVHHHPVAHSCRKHCSFFFFFFLSWRETRKKEKEKNKQTRQYNEKSLNLGTEAEEQMLFSLCFCAADHLNIIFSFVQKTKHADCSNSFLLSAAANHSLTRSHHVFYDSRVSK